MANVVAVSAQLPVGFLVDRLGSRRMLVAALLGAGIAFIALGLAPSYGHLLLAMALVGLTNAVFHPADYALLSAKIPNPGSDAPSRSIRFPGFSATPSRR